ncbi:MAG: hypothetical protein IT366_22640 [Candidatus Hydrogenedentes bacterium]|nr:hypothetical protein [Candidatus Hydrogenedentota bacterium]
MRLDAKTLPTILREAIDHVANTGARVIIEMSDGQRVGLVPVEDLEFVQEIEDRMDNESADAAIAEGGLEIPWDIVKQEIDQES